MDKLLEMATIKIKTTGETKMLAKVILNWNDEFEVRFCRIMRHPNGSLWFQPPALTGFGGAKCFAVIKVEDWHKLEKRVFDKFFEVIKKEKPFSDEFIDELEKSNQLEEINPDDIPL